MAFIMETITLKDFNPWNQWKEVKIPHRDRVSEYDSGERHQDQSTGRIYWLQDKDTLRMKCTALLIWTVVAHVVKMISRIGCVFARPISDSRATLKERFINSGKDVLRIVVTPVLVVYLEMAALYGIFNPYDGRKLYASGERFAYNNLNIDSIDLFGRFPSICAPCFQPNATHHALGGDQNNANAW